MSQFDFSSDDPTGRTAEYALQLVGAPKLTMLHAGMTNKGYTNHLVRLSAKTGAAKRLARGQATAETLEENLGLDRKLFPLHVITGWSGVINTDGEEVPFSKEACTEYLAALPAWVMQDLSRFAALATNFLDDEAPSDEDVADQAGN